MEIVSATGLSQQQHICKTGKLPNVHFGGYNVPYANYSSESAYFDDLWNGTRLGTHDVSVLAATHFDRNDLSGLTGDVFAIQMGHKLGQFRGIGVFSGADDSDTEISEDEGVFIDFDGLFLREISFGVRAFFKDGNNVNEIGFVHLYKNHELLSDEVYSFTTEGEDGKDGQEFFSLTSRELFDGVSFTTHSHLDNQNTEIEKGHHDFFLEYLDLCYETTGSVSGDPHFTTWAGDHYDYHGLCDLVFLQNPGFKNGLGMDIHIRTKKFKQWSYVSNVALQIENDILEVTSGTGTGGDIGVQYWISYIAGDSTLTQEKDTVLPYTIAGYPVIFRRLSLQSVQFTVDLGDDAKITIETWKKLVRVDIHGATDTDFGASLGLMGSFQDGKHMARDNNTVLENINDFGQEWQVRGDEPKLFHNADGAQHPQQCQSPTVADMKRRLGHSLVSQEEAEIACARASVSDFELCVFDVMATSDVNVAGAF